MDLFTRLTVCDLSPREGPPVREADRSQVRSCNLYQQIYDSLKATSAETRSRHLPPGAAEILYERVRRRGVRIRAAHHRRVFSPCSRTATTVFSIISTGAQC